MLILRKAILGASETPDIIDDVVGRISGEKRREGIFCGSGRDLNGIRNDKGGHLFLERDDFRDWNDELQWNEQR